MRIKYLCFSLFLLWSRVGLTAESKPRSRSQDDTTAEESKQEKMTFLRTHRKKIAGIGMPVALITTACILLGVRPQWRYAIRYTVKPPTQEDFIDALQKNDNHYLERVLQYIKEDIDLNKSPQDNQSSLEYLIRQLQCNKLAMLLQSKKTKDKITEQEIQVLFWNEFKQSQPREAMVNFFLKNDKTKQVIEKLDHKEIFYKTISVYSSDALETLLGDGISTWVPETIERCLQNIEALEERTEVMVQKLQYLIEKYPQNIDDNLLQKIVKSIIRINILQDHAIYKYAIDNFDRLSFEDVYYKTLFDMAKSLLEKTKIDFNEIAYKVIHNANGQPTLRLNETIGEQEDSLLHYCIKNGNSLSLMLIGYIQNPNKKDKEGKSLLRLALDEFDSRYGKKTYQVDMSSTQREDSQSKGKRATLNTMKQLSVTYDGRTYGTQLYEKIIQLLCTHKDIDLNTNEYQEAKLKIAKRDL